ncbi:MAG: hypothetical protein HOI42_13975 [Candidatus Marinimicrobia bacterium]|nr:hypothetical protein [Candidatus Neomarinimicrobiota bacterium]
MRGPGRGKKLRNHYRWHVDRKRIEYCKICGGDKEKCATCPWDQPPALQRVNFDAWNIFQEIKTQLRAGPAGVIGLDYKEMRQAIGDQGLYRSRGLEQKIKALERELLENVGK